MGRLRRLKPGVLVGGMIDDELGDDPDSPIVCFAHEGAEVPDGAIVPVNATVIGDVVAVVLQGRRIERQQPERGDPQVLQIVELLHETAEVSVPVAVAVKERLDVNFVDDRVLVPEGIAVRHEGFRRVETSQR